MTRNQGSATPALAGACAVGAAPLLAWFALIGAGLALAADPASAPPDLYDPSRAEVRAGYLVGISFPWDSIRSFPEHGTGNLNTEFVLPKFWHWSRLPDFLLPRLNAGVTANLDGRTSYAYGGVLWTLDITRRTFGEIFFGGLVHNGELQGTDPRLAHLGCRELYRVGFNWGYRFDQHTSAMLTFDHGSNGEPLLSGCGVNEGIDVLGLRMGYSF